MPQECGGHRCVPCGRIVYLRVNSVLSFERISECDNVQGPQAFCTSRTIMSCPVCGNHLWNENGYLRDFQIVRFEEPVPGQVREPRPRGRIAVEEVYPGDSNFIGPLVPANLICTCQACDW